MKEKSKSTNNEISSSISWEDILNIFLQINPYSYDYLEKMFKYDFMEIQIQSDNPNYESGFLVDWWSKCNIDIYLNNLKNGYGNITEYSWVTAPHTTAEILWKQKDIIENYILVWLCSVAGNIALTQKIQLGKDGENHLRNVRKIYYILLKEMNKRNIETWGGRSIHLAPKGILFQNDFNNIFTIKSIDDYIKLLTIEINSIKVEKQLVYIEINKNFKVKEMIK